MLVFASNGNPNGRAVVNFDRILLNYARSKATWKIKYWIEKWSQFDIKLTADFALERSVSNRDKCQAHFQINQFQSCTSLHLEFIEWNFLSSQPIALFIFCICIDVIQVNSLKVKPVWLWFQVYLRY